MTIGKQSHREITICSVFLIRGNVKIGLPVVGDRVSVQAQGVDRFKALFLNASEKRALAQLAKQNAREHVSVKIN